MADRRSFLKSGTGLLAALPRISRVAAAMVRSPADSEVLAPLQIDLRGSSLHFRAGWCEIPNWTMALEVGNEVLQTKDSHAKLISREPFQVQFDFPKRQLSWIFEAETDHAANTVLLRSTIHNESGSAVPLGKAYLLQTDGIAGFFNPGDTVVYLPMTSGQVEKQVQKFETGPTTNDMAIQAFNQSQNKAIQAGFVTFQRAQGLVTHEFDPTKALQLKAWCEFDGWQLEPGTSTTTETLILAVGRNPHAQLEAWAHCASLLCQPSPREWASSASGWGGGSWVDEFVAERNEYVALGNAKAIRQRMAGFGLDYIWLSIDNLKNDEPGNWLEWNFKNYPDGHQYVYDQLQKLGFKLGLWCGAFMVSSRVPEKVHEFNNAFFKKPDGSEPMVYMKDWGYRPAGRSTSFEQPTHGSDPVYALDPSNPQTVEFLRKVFQTYREWGVRYYMIDFLWAGADTLNSIPHAKHYDKKLISGPEVFRKGLQTIREACGDDTHLLAATGPTIQTAGYMDAVRTGNDFGEGRYLNNLFDTYPGTYVINAPGHWSGPKHAILNQAATYYTHRKLYINNSGDMLTVDKPMPLSQAQVNATVHAMSGGPSMLGDDIRYIDDERLSLIKKTLPRPTDVAFPVDLFSKREQAYPRVFHRRINKPWGSYDVVVVYNLETDRPIQQDVDLRSIGLDDSRSYLVWDFWNSGYLGKIHGRLSAQVPPYSVKVYRLTEDMGQPVILGTDMHVVMGEMEVDRCHWDSAQKVFSGRAIRPAGERGSVFIYAPPDLAVANPKGYYLAHDERDNSLIIRCPFQFEDGSGSWNIEFFHFVAPSNPHGLGIT